MHWLPLVAMVIASALPFPHNVSRIAAASTEQHHDPAARLVDYDSPDYNNHNHHNNMDRQKLQDDVREKHQSQSDSGSERPDLHADPGSIRVQEDPEEKAQDYRSESSRQDYSSFLDFTKEDKVQDRPSPVPPAGEHSLKGPEGVEGLEGPQTTGPSLKEEPTVGTGGHRTPGETEVALTQEAGPGAEPGLDGVLEGDEMFLDAHPRVLFSPSLWPPEEPPLLLMLETGLLEEQEVEDGDREDQEDVDGHIEGHGDWATERSAARTWAPSSSSSKSSAADVGRPLRRDKRSHLNDRRRGEKSVCESESVWVTNKTSAIDNYGQVVTILQKIQTQAGTLRQYFYETRCRQAEQQSAAAGRLRPGASGGGGAGKTPLTGVAGAGCLGVDKKQWLSECKAKQSFVRALTKDANNRTGWRWIRIDSSCVCVLLSRTNQALAREVLTRKGRG